jgi:hypothetical protein
MTKTGTVVAVRAPPRRSRVRRPIPCKCKEKGRLIQPPFDCGEGFEPPTFGFMSPYFQWASLSFQRFQCRPFRPILAYSGPLAPFCPALALVGANRLGTQVVDLSPAFTSQANAGGFAQAGGSSFPRRSHHTFLRFSRPSR